MSVVEPREDEDELPLVGKADLSTLTLQLDRVRRAKRDADNEAKNLRDRLRAAEEKLGGLTGEGVVVLKGDDASAYREYASLGKPAEIKAKLDRTDALSAELGGLKRTDAIRDVAEIVGYKPAVLTRLGGDREYVVKDEQEDGKPVKRAYVKTEQGDKPLADYAAAEWGDFLPALTATNAAQQGQQSGGVRYPAQGSGDPPKPTDPATSYLDRTYGPRKTA